MFHYVTDKEYLRQTYSICADIVNQLVQCLKRYDVDAEMSTVGSKKRGLITQNERGPIDYDFNLLIRNANSFTGQKLKNTVMKAFDEVLEKNNCDPCQDSTSALTAGQFTLKKGNRTQFSIDVAIIKTDYSGSCYRLIHRKTGIAAFDQWYWNMLPNSQNIWEKEDYLKPEYWLDVRNAYLEKKNMYLCRNDYDHPSFICYIEALNEVYMKVRRQQGHWN